MGSALAVFQSTFAKLTVFAIVDILITAFLVYQFLLIVKGRRAAQVLVGLSILAALYLVALLANLDLLRTLLAAIAPYTAFGILVMFQSEIRRILAQLGRRGWVGFSGRLKHREFVEEILSAVEQLAKARTGALIILERYAGLRSFVESGVALDAVVSADLLLAIFEPKGPLHDGAVIVQQNERIAAAACFLPLSMSASLMSTMGTRHRAGIGVTEESDALALIVSEETGAISVAAFGQLQRDLKLSEIGPIIAAHLGGRTKEEALRAEEPALEEHTSGQTQTGERQPVNRP
jgi:diadenylate cyclase